MDGEAGEAAIDGLAGEEAGFGDGGVGEEGRACAGSATGRRLRACIMQRSKRVGKGASRKMVEVAGVCSSSRRLVRTSGVPPPRARTMLAAAEGRGQGGGLKLAEAGLAMGAKMAGTVRPVRGLDVGVEVEELPAEALGEQAADGGLAGAHEAGEDEAAEVGGWRRAGCWGLRFGRRAGRS